MSDLFEEEESEKKDVSQSFSKLNNAEIQELNMNEIAGLVPIILFKQVLQFIYTGTCDLFHPEILRIRLISSDTGALSAKSPKSQSENTNKKSKKAKRKSKAKREQKQENPDEKAEIADPTEPTESSLSEIDKHPSILELASELLEPVSADPVPFIFGSTDLASQPPAVAKPSAAAPGFLEYLSTPGEYLIECGQTCTPPQILKQFQHFVKRLGLKTSQQTNKTPSARLDFSS